MAAPWPGLHGIKTVLGLPVGVIAPGVCGLVDEGWLEKRMAPRGEPRHQKSDATPVPTSRSSGWQWKTGKRKLRLLSLLQDTEPDDLLPALLF